MRPFDKVFEAQPCAGRSQWAEHENIKIFEIGKCLPLPLSDLRKIYFTSYCNKKVNIVQCQKTWYPPAQLTEALPAQGWAPKTFKKRAHPTI